MASSEYEVRKAKVQQLRNSGILPYAPRYEKKHSIADLHRHDPETCRAIEDIIEQPQMHFTTAGRITLFRSHGKLAFAKLLDESDEIQLMFHRDMCFVQETAKSGDFVSVL